MIIPLSSPHVHTQFCDGRSTAREMVEAALAHGFVSVGLSSHALQAFDRGYSVQPGQEKEYKAHVRALQAEYAGRIRVWLGMERDAYAMAKRSGYDYVIGSVHYLFHAGEWFTVDGDIGVIARSIDTYYGGSGENMAVDYFTRLGRYVRAWRPDIIGHFDLPMRHNRQGELYDPLDVRVVQAAQSAMDLCIQGCDVMEVNTGAIARSGATLPYPALAYLRYWRSLGGRVVLSSDCHNARDIAAGYAQGLLLMREAGYRDMVLLGRADTLWESAALV